MFIPPTVTASDSGFSRAPLQSGQSTSRMYCSTCSRDQSDSASECRRVSHGMTPSKLRRVGAPAAEAVLVLHVDRLALGAIEDELLVLGPELLPGRVDGEAADLGQPAQDPGEVLASRRRPWRDRPAVDREIGVGNDQLGVDLETGPEPGTTRAGSVRRVEREIPRRRLLEAQPAVGASKMLAEGDPLLTLSVGDLGGLLGGPARGRHEDLGGAAGQLERGLDGFGEPVPDAVAPHQSVDHDLDGVLLVASERQIAPVGQLEGHPVHPHAGEPLAGQVLQE